MCSLYFHHIKFLCFSYIVMAGTVIDLIKALNLLKTTVYEITT